MSPFGSAVILAAWLALAGADKRDDATADAVTLRDGKVVLGELIDSSPKAGTLSMVVRRAWAREYVPAWADKWEAAEAPGVRRAAAQRRERLDAWRRDRLARPEPDDRITPWIDRELVRLRDEAGGPPSSTLLIARLSRGDARTIVRAPAGRTRLLRLAWVSKFSNPETMKADALKGAIEGRGFDPTASSPVSIDALLPLQPESESAWLIRRAATEVSTDEGLRFVRYGSVVLPEPASGQAMNLGGGLAAVSALKDLLGENPGDPLLPRLQGVAARGRVGAVVTRLDTAADLSGVTVEMTLWVRQVGDRWVPAGSRSARVRPEDLGPEAGKDLADDPQIATVFRTIEAIGFGGIDPEIKRKSLNIGAATRKALGAARSAAEADLAGLSLPVLAAPQEKEAAPKDAAP